MLNNTNMYSSYLSRASNPTNHVVTNTHNRFALSEPSINTRINQINERSQFEQNFNASRPFPNVLRANSKFDQGTAIVDTFSEPLDSSNTKLDEQISRRMEVIAGHCNQSSNNSRVKRQINFIKDQFIHKSEKTQKIQDASEQDQNWVSSVNKKDKKTNLLIDFNENQPYQIDDSKVSIKNKEAIIKKILDKEQEKKDYSKNLFTAFGQNPGILRAVDMLDMQMKMSFFDQELDLLRTILKMIETDDAVKLESAGKDNKKEQTRHISKL